MDTKKQINTHKLYHWIFPRRTNYLAQIIYLYNSRMPSVQTFLSILMLTHSVTYVGGLSQHNMNNKQSICNNNSRRAFLSTTAATAFFTAVTTTIPQIANARYVLNEVTGEYDEVQDDEDWQSAWGKRLDKAKTMSKEDIFLAAQGAY